FTYIIGFIMVEKELGLLDDEEEEPEAEREEEEDEDEIEDFKLDDPEDNQKHEVSEGDEEEDAIAPCDFFRNGISSSTNIKITLRGCYFGENEDGLIRFAGKEVMIELIPDTRGKRLGHIRVERICDLIYP
ncbi:hypothetical protein ACJX0J_008494, partial [Zea mays]